MNSVISRWAVLLVCFAASSAQGQEWTRFRGPNGTGQSEAKSIPATFKDIDYNWKTKLPGIGHSSPVIWGEKVFLLSANPDDATRYVLCLSAADGKILWKKDYPTAAHHLHTRSSYASSTPAVDAERVYFAWSDPDHMWLLAFTHDGKELWKQDYGPWVSQHGFGSSPVLVDDMVVVNWSQEPSKQANTPDPKTSFVVAADQKTGNERWRTAHKVNTTSYSVPCLYKTSTGENQLICCNTAEGMYGLNPKSGEELWALKVFKMRTVSSPVLVGDMLFGSTGSGAYSDNYLVGIKLGEKPDLAYQLKNSRDFKAPYVPSSVARGDLLFLIYDKGYASCIDIPSGKVLWFQRTDGAAFSGSPVRVHDKVFAMDEEGTVWAWAADKEYNLLGQSPLGEPSRATPAVAGGRMYLRTESHLISVGGKAL
jgi:outer membrane protein assembly factor BamB